MPSFATGLVGTSSLNIPSNNQIITDLIDRVERLEDEVDRLKAENITPLNNQFVTGILNKITMLKNVIKKNIGDENGELFSTKLIAVEKIESEVIQTKSVTQRQLQQLNDLYIEQKTYKKI